MSQGFCGFGLRCSGRMYFATIREMFYETHRQSLFQHKRIVYSSIHPTLCVLLFKLLILDLEWINVRLHVELTRYNPRIHICWRGLLNAYLRPSLHLKTEQQELEVVLVLLRFRPMGRRLCPSTPAKCLGVRLVCRGLVTVLRKIKCGTAAVTTEAVRLTE